MAFLGIAVPFLEGLGEAGLAGAGIGAVRAAPWWRPCCEVAVSQIDRPWLDEQSVHFSSANDFFFPCFSRPHLGSVPDFRFPVEDGPTDAYSSSAVLRRPQKGRVAALRDEPSKARACPLRASARSPVRLAVLGSLGVTLS